MTAKNINETKKWLRAARTISEALPYMRRFSGRTCVIKYGGHAMGDASLAENFAEDVVLLKQVGINPVVVHGGGPQIATMLERLNIESRFVDGLRVTDAAAIEVVEMVLSGTINKQIVSTINAAGGTAVGLSGKDGKLLEARRLTLSGGGNENDLGFVGEPARVNIGVLQSFEKSHIIPVVAPIGIGPEGETYNINADTAAGAIAGAIEAARLLMLTDVSGVLGKDGELIPDMNVDEARAYISNGTITGGMIPKVETCIGAVQAEVDAAVILDGRTDHAILLEVFTDHGVGTAIWP